MEAWHWFVLGIVLMVLEVFVFGAVLLWTGIAAMIVGVIALSYPAMTWEFQVVAFVVIALVSVAVGLGLRKRRAHAPTPQFVNLGTARFVGQEGILDTAIVAGRGSLRLGESVWPVTGPDMPAGTRVKIIASDGVSLTVAKA